MVTWLWTLTTALASAPSCQPYRSVQFRADLAMVTDAIADNDVVDARNRLGQIGEQLPCSLEPVHHELFAKFARYMAHTHQAVEDEVGASRWLLSARVSAPDLGWNATVFPDRHPLRRLNDTIEWPLPSPLTAGLHPPRRGAIFLNGHIALDASAPEGVTYFAQAFDGEGRPVDAWWQEGGTFPDEYLTKGFHDVRAPTWWRPGV